MPKHRRLALAATAACLLAGLPAAAASLPESVADGTAVLAARPRADQVLAIVLALRPRDPAGLAALVGHLTDPRDAMFRHWISAADFAGRFGPDQARYDGLRAGLAAAGLALDAPLASRMAVGARGRIGDLERLLHVRFGFYREPGSQHVFLSPDREPVLDAAPDVLGIEGLSDESAPVSHVVHGAALPAAGGSGPHGQFTGGDMRHAYYGNGALTGAGQSVGVFEIGGYDRADLQAYFDKTGLPFHVPIVDVALDGVTVACTMACHDGEQVLDMDQVISMAPGLAALFYYDGKNPFSILARMASDDSCATLSVSYGWKPNPGLDEPVMQEMAAQGQTLLVATGDDGFHLKQGVVWPADDPWAIAVGGTDLRTQGAGGPWKRETGWRFSGGGPSPDGIAIPAWQMGFVTAANGASASLRNVPDISAEANTDNFYCANGHCGGGDGGTSYAAPRLAGFVALADEQAALAGLPSVGFFTPALYSRVSAVPDLHDVTLGFNGRYHDVEGFDLVTGLGTPFGALTMRALVSP